MAQVEKTVPVEHDILAWDLWKIEELKKSLPSVDRSAVNRAGRPILVYLSLALAVMLPMLLPGYILTLDMAFTPELRMPEQMSSSYLFHAALHYLNFVLPGDVIQKIMLLAILLLSGLGMYALMRHIQNSKDGAGGFAEWGAYAAGALYMINPFVYSRFMAGQYAVLLGYALLPFFVRALLRFFAVPTLQRSLAASAWLVGIGIVSLHTLGLAAVVTVASLAVFAWRYRSNSRITMAAISYGIAGVLAFVVASGYWLIPLLAGSSNQGQAVAQFTGSDQQAFQTAGASVVERLGNVLQLQGFWAEAEGLYLLPHEQLPGWPLVVLGVWAVVGIGAAWMWRKQRAVAALFILSGIVGAMVAVAGLDGSGALAGFREPHKFVGLLVLSYALFAGMGTSAVLAWAKKKHGEVVFSTVAILVLLLPVLYTPTMFWGFSGQLSPRQYPADWYQMNTLLNQDATNFQVLSLPWHLYMHYPFAGRVIVNPSDKFFDKPTITSNELEFRNASPTFPDADKNWLSKQILPDAASNPALGKKLDELNIKYVLLAKTYDYQDYAYLDERSGFELISETANLKLYRNLAYGQ